jgi:hypothetical protein
MNKIEFLLQQAARAERLAKTIMDKLTVERLQAFAVECRTQAKTLDEAKMVGLELHSCDKGPDRREGDCARQTDQLPLDLGSAGAIFVDAGLHRS